MSWRAAFAEALAALVEVPSVSSPSEQRCPGRGVLDRCEALLGRDASRILEVVPCDDPDHPARVWQLGRGEPALQFAGHLDTVPAEGVGWTGDPWSLREARDRWLGLGVADMKGALAALVVAWRWACDEFGPPRRALRLVASTDEESGMRGARELARAGALLPVPTILGEPTGGSRWHGHRGIVAFRCGFTGRGGHAGLASASSPGIAYRALLRFATAFERLWQTQGGSEIQDEARSWSGNLGHIRAGDAFNRIAPQVSVEGEVRFPPPHRAGAVAERLRALVQEAAQEVGVDSTWELLVEVEPFVGEVEGTWAPYASEAGFFPQGGRFVALWGPGEVEAAHRPDEWLDVETLGEYLVELRAWLREGLW